MPNNPDAGIPVFQQDVAHFQNQKTLRDEFAMAALTGILTIEATYHAAMKESDPDGTVAEGAYKLADAMLAARKK